jgi:hypothetical protein
MQHIRLDADSILADSRKLSTIATIPMLRTNIILTFLAPLFLIGQQSHDDQTMQAIGDGPYPVASSNIDCYDAVLAPMHQYLVGAIRDEQPVYLNSLLKYPDFALNFQLDIPDIPDLYGSIAGSNIPVVCYLLYPTTSSNQAADYHLPYGMVMDRVFPRMDAPGQSLLPAIPGARLPLIVYSHGMLSHGVWLTSEAKFLASHGYAVLVVFHGDGRVEDHLSKYAMRPLVLKAAIDYILDHPRYGSMMDPASIGVSGSSFGGFSSVALMGGLFLKHPDSITDSRVKAGFATVPWLGAGGNRPFGNDDPALQGVEKPFMAVIGSVDTIAEPEVARDVLGRITGASYVFEVEGEGHELSPSTNLKARTLQLLFFDSFLRRSSSMHQLMQRISRVEGASSMVKILQKAPGEYLNPAPDSDKGDPETPPEVEGPQG